jgi:hypothetical protein
MNCTDKDNNFNHIQVVSRGLGPPTEAAVEREALIPVLTLSDHSGHHLAPFLRLVLVRVIPETVATSIRQLNLATRPTHPILHPPYLTGRQSAISLAVIHPQTRPGQPKRLLGVVQHLVN